MKESKKFLLFSLTLIIVGILLILAGNPYTFTLACMSFIGAGGCWNQSLEELRMEDYEQSIVNGEVEESVSVDLDEIADEDKEVLERVLGMNFDKLKEGESE